MAAVGQIELRDRPYAGGRWRDVGAMSREVTRRLLREQIEDVWGTGRTDLVDANYTPDVIDHMPVAGQPPGLKALKQVVTDFRRGIADMRMDLHHVMAAGDFGVDLWTLSGTHTGELFGQPSTGAAVRFSGIDMVRIREEKIAELWHVEEMAHLAQQIGLQSGEFGAPVSGVIPPPSTDIEYRPGANAFVPGIDDFSEKERRNLAVARRHIEEIWAKGRSELCWELYHPDAIDHNPAPDQRPGIEGIIDVLGWLREAVPDLRMEIQCYVIEGDWIADRWVMTGTHSGAPLMGIPAQGRTFRINGMDVARLDEAALITDIWHCEEFASLLSQIGPQ
ncbi:MAG: ester cyclase [Sphingomonadaceae bacterium]|nr:ester cyclase [Sphingomonadaceae bacterium]